MPEQLTLKGIKTFQGMEGYGLNATLYFKGKKAAFVLDEGCGGEMMYHWQNGMEPVVLDHCRKMPKIDHQKECVELYGQGWWDKLGVEAQKRMAKEDKSGRERLDRWINAEVDRRENEKRLKRLCRNKLVFQTTEGKAKNEYQTLNSKYTPHAAAWVRKKYPDAVILNEQFAPQSKGKVKVTV